MARDPACCRPRTALPTTRQSTPQALTTAEIEGMKREGKAGQEIVAALTAGSATFAAKTEFSQAKYR